MVPMMPKQVPAKVQLLLIGISMLRRAPLCVRSVQQQNALFKHGSFSHVLTQQDFDASGDYQEIVRSKK